MPLAIHPKIMARLQLLLGDHSRLMLIYHAIQHRRNKSLMTYPRWRQKVLVAELEVRIAESLHGSSDTRMPASPASSTTSSSYLSSSYTSLSPVPSTLPSHVVSPHRHNVSQSQPRSGTLVIGDPLL